MTTGGKILQVNEWEIMGQREDRTKNGGVEKHPAEGD
jgi:hypothetical protein